MADPESRPGSLAAAGRATIILTGGMVVVQIIGLGRQLFLAAEVGISSEFDALLIALSMPAATVAILTVGVTTAMVPAYVEAKETKGEDAARRLTGAVAVWLALAGLIFSGLLWLFAEPIVEIAAPGLAKNDTAGQAVGYLRLLAPMALLSTLSAVMHAVCQAERLFIPMTISTVASPLVALGVMVSYWNTLALEGLALGTIAGATVSLVVLTSATVVRRVFPRLTFLARGLGLRALARHAIPLSLSSAVLQVNQIVDQAISSWLLPGGVSALRYGSSVVRLPFGAIRPAYGTAIYPTLVQASRDSSTATGLGATTERVLRYGVVFFVPLAGLTIAVAPLATAILYDRGSFSDADLRLTAQVVAVSAPLVVTWTAYPAIVSALNARRQGRIVLTGGILTAVTNITLDVVLGFSFGLVGIASATTVTSIVLFSVQGHRLSRLEPQLSLRLVWQKILRASLATMPAVLLFGVPIWAGFVGDDLSTRVVVLVTAGVVGLISYYRVARLLGLEEASAIIGFATTTARRTARRAIESVRPSGRAGRP